MASGTALLSKVGGVGLQLVAIPLMIRELGPERYGVFILVGSILSFITFAQFGVGGHLLRIVSSSLAKGNEAEVPVFFWTAVVLVGCVGAFLAIGGGLTPATVGMEWLWGEVYHQHKDLLNWGIYWVIGVAWFTLVGGLFSAAQAGYQELHLVNIYGGLGNLLSAGALAALVCLGVTSERSLWLGLYAPSLLCLVIGSIHFLHRHPVLRVIKICPTKMLPMLNAGGSFAVVQTLLPLIHREFPRVLLARAGELVEVARLSSLFQVSTLAGGLLVVFTQPLFGAVADAYARGDYRWCRRRLYQAWGATLVLSMGVLTLSATIGSKLITLWLGDRMKLESTVLLAYGAYFGLTTLMHVNFVFLLASGRARQAALIATGEMILVVSWVMIELSLGVKCGAGEFLVVLGAVQLIFSVPLSIWKINRIYAS